MAAFTMATTSEAVGSSDGRLSLRRALTLADAGSAAAAGPYDHDGRCCYGIQFANQNAW